MDNFRVKYEKKEDAMHLMNILKNNYKVVTEDWKGKFYAEIHLHWDYKRGKVHQAMPDYIKKILLLFQNSDKYKLCHTQYSYTPPLYEGKVQLAKQESTTPELPEQAYYRNKTSRKEKLYIMQEQ